VTTHQASYYALYIPISCHPFRVSQNICRANQFNLDHRDSVQSAATLAQITTTHVMPMVNINAVWHYIGFQ
jgi:hypothetical protein